MNKITEAMLLDGYVGVANDGVTAVSLIGTEEIFWKYRKGDKYDGVTQNRAEAKYIYMARAGNNWIGDIPLVHTLTPPQKLVVTEYAQLVRELWNASGDDEIRLKLKYPINKAERG
jgi:hypothetical protein